MPEPSSKHDRILRATVKVPEHVIHRAFEAETLMLNLETGQYHGLNETGGRLLELLEAHGGRVDEAIAALADEYQVPAEEITPELVDFCRELEERGLVRVEEAEPSA